MKKAHSAIVSVLMAVSFSAVVFADGSTVPAAPAENAAPTSGTLPPEQNVLDPALTAAKPPSRAEMRDKVRTYRQEQMELLRQQQIELLRQQQMPRTPADKNVPN